MTKKERDKIIKEKYKTGNYTLEQIGLEQKPPLTAERVRQIIDPIVLVHCKEHRYKYRTKETCIYHDIDFTYEHKNFSMSELMEKLYRLQKPDRRREIVYERSIITRLLRNKYKLTSSFIANLLKQDLTTVKHHLKER